MKHLVLINFKTYEEGTGRKGLKLAEILNRFNSVKFQLAIAPQTVDLNPICQKVKIPVFAQHLDAIGAGPHTGSILPEAIKEAGAIGTLLNHSEKRIKLSEIKTALELCNQLNLTVVVCASSLIWVKRIAKLNPSYIAYEPKKLIGKNISVTEANPKVITKAVKIIQRINPQIKLLCGAGIHSSSDIQRALELGAEGVLIAHTVVKEKNTLRVLNRLFNNNN